jgi:hypothetical protein
MTAVPPFFSADPANDVVYRNLKGSQDPRVQEIRAHCESLWQHFFPYADEHFLAQLAHHFHARYWEMYLAVTIMDCGYVITAPKPGPDIGITVNGRRVWFEAVTAGPGADGNPDQVPDLQLDDAGWVPNAAMILRYTQAIREKVLVQYTQWRAAGHVSSEDCFIVALNPRMMDFEMMDAIPPRILQAAYPIGMTQVVVNPQTLKLRDGGVQYRASIQRANGREINTGIFLDPQYASLSALLCSRVNSANQPPRLGGDFQLAPNPRATVPLPAQLRLRGVVFGARTVGDQIEVHPIQLDKVPDGAGCLEGAEIPSMQEILSDPEWMADPQSKARRVAAEVINELCERKGPK